MKYPRHVAIIADGNRTRAKEKGLSAMDWHFAGAENTIAMLKHIYTTTPINVVTGWFLSTENLKARPQAELDFIFSIYKTIWNDLHEFLLAHKVNFKRVGDRHWIAADFLEFLDGEVEKLSFPDSDKVFVFALNYWGRDEIIRWMKKVPHDKIDTLTEEEFTTYLDFAEVDQLDLVIRTKGDKAHRTSWFMSRWIWYAELYFAKDYYPAFTNDKLEEALKRFDAVSEERNYWK